MEQNNIQSMNNFDTTAEAAGSAGDNRMDPLENYQENYLKMFNYVEQPLNNQVQVRTKTFVLKPKTFSASKTSTLTDCP